MKTKVKRRFGDFWLSEGGAVAVIFGLSLVPMIAAVGVSVDLLRLTSARMVLQASLDSASLAVGASKLTDTQKIQALTQSYVTANAGSLDLQVTSLNVTQQQAPTGEKMVTVEAAAQLSTTFMKVMNVDSLTIRTSTVVQKASPGPMHLALVLDVTASMTAVPSTGGSRTKMQILRSAALELVDEVIATASPDTRIGIVPYSGNVRLYPAASLPSPVPGWIRPRSNTVNSCVQYSAWSPPNCAVWVDCVVDGVFRPNGCISHANCTRTCLQTQQITNNWNGCIGPRVFELNGTTYTTAYLETIANPTAPPYPGMPSNAPECPTSVLLPLTNDWTTLRSRINGLAAVGNTYIPSGLTWGWNMLDENDPYPAASLTALGGQKVMVLMTDGVNSVGVRSPDGFLTPAAFNASVVNGRTSALCQKIKDSGIKVFTVLFDVQDATTQTMLRDCATSSSMAFVAEDSNQLVQAFRDIADMLRTVKILR